MQIGAKKLGTDVCLSRGPPNGLQRANLLAVEDEPRGICRGLVHENSMSRVDVRAKSRTCLA